MNRIKQFVSATKTAVCIAVLCGVALVQAAAAQNDSTEYIRTRGLSMLTEAKKAIEEKYFDPKFRGVNLEEKFEQAKRQIKAGKTNSEVYLAIAQFMLALDDSHTGFSPPIFEKTVDYGIEMQMIGATCYVTRVEKGSDAEAKGVKVGDIVDSFQTFTPTRETFWQIYYLFYQLNPVEKYTLVLADNGANRRPVEIKASFSKTRHLLQKAYKKRDFYREPFVCKKINPETTACRLPTFEVSVKEIDAMMREAAESKNLILDLRRNSGGYVRSVENLIGYFFDRQIKIGTEIERNKSEEIRTKPQPKKYYAGNLTVLVDSLSASAAEVFARVIQLEKRGTIIGDRTAGQVMTSINLTKEFVRVGFSDNEITPYGLSITISDLLMSDGKSLEKIGVKPDQIYYPNKNHLANKFDIVLSNAARKFGADLSPEAAGKIFRED